jgi:hypothetical protein
MIRRAMTTGIIGGLLAVIGALYPVLAVFVPVLVTGWQSPIQNQVLHAVLLMASAVVFIAAFLLTPVIAVLRSDVRGFGAGAHLGAIASLFVGLNLCLDIALPLNSLNSWRILEPFLRPLLDPQPQTIVDFILKNFSNGAGVILITVVACALFGLAIGGFLNLIQARGLPPITRPDLYTLTLQGKQKNWFNNQDEATLVALWVGLIVGVLLTFSEIQTFYSGFNDLWPDLQPLLTSAAHDMLAVRFIPLPPLAALAVILMGGVVVALIKNPTGRYWQRVTAVVVSINVASVIWLMQFSRTIAIYLGLSPFLVMHAQAEMDPAEFAPMAAQLLASPQVQIALAFLTPWVIIFAVSLAVDCLGLMAGLFYAACVPLFKPRAVDRAGRLCWQFKRDPAQTLVLLYQLFDRNHEAYEVLAHATVSLKRRHADTARLVAAFHTLGTTPTTDTTNANEVAVRLSKLVGDIADLIDQHPEWRGGGEISSVHRSLSQILLAESLDSFLQIQPPKEIGTTSVPPMMVKAVNRISEIIEQLYKVNRVDDLPSKLTFLNNTLEAINRAQRFVEGDMRDPKAVATPYPPQPALVFALERWEQMVITATRRLKGRADVTATLKSNRVAQTARLPITFLIQNRGLNVAERLRLKLLGGDDYFVVPPAEAALDILPAGESHELTLFVEARPEAKRLRLEWEVTFDDSVEKTRIQKFADVAEFVQPERPFQRIFPIPYVTGTPLKDGEVFVGRQDIFEFVKENLIGTSQNNIIILHGQRRTGKTSVLYRLGQVLADSHVAVLIDMQGKPARGESDFLFSIADDIVYALERQNIEAPLPEKKDFEESPEFFFRSRFIRSLYPLLGNRNLLLLFDEFEELQRRVDEGKLEAGIFQFLRNLMQHEEKIDFIFAGTHKLEELGSDYWSVLFNTAIYKRITFLAPSEVRRLIIEPIGKSNLEYDPLAMDMIASLTAGHPYFTQILLHEVIAYHNESQRTYLTAADIEQAVDRVLERGEAHFKYLWAESTEHEQKAMRLLAEALVGKTEINMLDLQTFCQFCGVTITPEHLEAVNNLVSRDIVTRTGRLFSFTVPLIERWVRRTHPVMA